MFKEFLRIYEEKKKESNNKEIRIDLLPAIHFIGEIVEDEDDEDEDYYSFGLFD
jgi:hypothetical protein